MDYFPNVVTKHGDIKRIADIAGVHPTTVARILNREIANPGVATVRRIEQAIRQLSTKRKSSEKPAKTKRAAAKSSSSKRGRKAA